MTGKIVLPKDESWGMKYPKDDFSASSIAAL